jgi:glycosyltransferase involved in cell wall biosynthesis
LIPSGDGSSSGANTAVGSELQVGSEEARELTDGETRPAVTVLMTTHAADPRLVDAALTSILTQTFSDFELVIVADGEVGAVQPVLDGVSHDARVRILRPGRIGRGPALNLGLEAARADLIAIHDSDDESHVRRLEYQVEAFARHPEIDLIATDRVVTHSTDSHADWSVEPFSDCLSIIDRELLTRNILTHTSVMVRSTLVERLNGYDTSRQRLFDYDLYLRARQDGMHLARLEIPLVLYRFHTQQWFGSEKIVLQRMREEAGLAYNHASEAPIPLRWWLTGMIALRVSVRFGRGYVARKRLEWFGPH